MRWNFIEALLGKFIAARTLARNYNVPLFIRNADLFDDI